MIKWFLIDILLVVGLWMATPKVLVHLTPNVPRLEYCVFGACSG